MASLSSRERVQRALSHQEADRIPLDFGGSSTSIIHVAAHRELARYLGIDDPEERLQSLMTQVVYPDPRLRARVGSDVLLIHPGKADAWTPQIEQYDDGHSEYTDEWGVRYTMPPGGYYYDWKDHPLKEGTLAELDRFRWPDPRDPGRYRGLKERAQELYATTDKALLINNPFGIWEQEWALRGFEKAFADLLINTAYAEALADRLLAWQTVYWEEVLGRIGPYVQVVKLNDDLGFKNGPLMSPRSYRQVYKPRHKALIAAVRERTDAKIFLHSDGDIYPFLPDFREIGFDILNPVEVTARDMDSAKLKAEYGDDFVFWGGACGNTLLSTGKPADVEAEVRRRIRDFAPGGGFVFATIHNLQAGIPPENIVTLFDTAQRWGRYPIVKS
ncbi:MAG: hypothetical protein IT330_08715 [Anaerolineae bacterium]|nr:hypothetical protein [Anaerolineae bacterium]